MARILAVYLSLCLAIPLAEAQGVPPGADPELVELGRYLVTAGDCRSCHGDDLRGGNPIESPIGSVYATNTTPDPDTGIGDWSLEELATAMREGRTPEHNMYPAMPYTAYTGLTDRDVRALYSFLMLDTEPIAYTAPETRLPLPFRRAAMTPWNTLFLDPGHPAGQLQGALDPEVERGRYVLESLGHCSSCHSPRGQMMQTDADRHMAGAFVSGWWAPNLTPHADGLGGWSDAQLRDYLTTGHTEIAVAGGEMGKVVANSTSRLTEADLDAAIAYLRALPPRPHPGRAGKGRAGKSAGCQPASVGPRPIRHRSFPPYVGPRHVKRRIAL